MNKELFEQIARWDGADAQERDRIRAMLWCAREGVKFDSIVGAIEGDVDRRIILYEDGMEGLGGGGSSIDMAAIDIWPAFAHQPKPRRWWHFLPIPLRVQP